ncbi:putative MFS transporter [Actinoplanes missouriensis 431]|uniref:Putative MFS transporter n=1 Tax=Actinoplanes missouriensis (strain ATCC 14538 / DSM 43046 / CBS 188.64 / JCM 3121 / NBRC 102363 / NCIMB 12654 / NRRL B-3342 / UNCC 431) TaxID=512565 RepID=I0HFT6_ACTM4|nr:MFS transporter [Actinoplanes missouriensis]BAL91873.1 putative MFS transporter [Actinoplanes missouriensis 431]
MALREKQAVSRRQGRLFLLTALLLAAVNLRLAVTSVGPVLTELRVGLGMSTTVAGLLTSVPVVCFAAIGLAAPRLARRFGAARVIFGGLVLLTLGLAARPYAGDSAVFLLLSAVALAGIALVNVLLPSVVKDRFPDQVGTVTGLYTVALNIGATTAAAATVPLTGAFGDDWRLGLACWALAAMVALPPWLLLARDRTETRNHDHNQIPVRVSRHPVAWALAVYFGMQSTAAYVIIGWLPQIYRDAGISAGTAGVLFATTSFLGVPLGFALSALAGRIRSQSMIALSLGLFGIAGWAGLLWSPTAAPWLWAVLLGVANTAFPLVLTMIALRGSHPGTVVKLSAFAQGIGYLIAIPGPFVIGALHDATDGWRAPLAVMLALTIPQIIAGVYAGRDRQI